MKKLFLIVLLSLVALSAMGQANPQSLPQVDTTSERSTWQLAEKLARYGYATRSAISLVAAERLFRRVPDQAPAARINPKAAVISPGKADSCTPRSLLAAAREMAAGNPDLLAVILQEESTLDDSPSVNQGAVGGPRFLDGILSGGETVTYKIRFWAGEYASVVVLWEGDGTMGLNITDEKGNNVATDQNEQGACMCEWIPKWTGYFYVFLCNRSEKEQRFILTTN